MDNPTSIRRPRPIEIRKPIQRELFDYQKGTGTNGPAPQLSTVPPRPVRIPYNVAFREVLGFVNQALEEQGEKWSPASKSDMVTSILQSMERWGVLCLWERK